MQAWGGEEPPYEGGEEPPYEGGEEDGMEQGYFGDEEEEGHADSPLNGSVYLQDLLPDDEEVIVG